MPNLEERLKILDEIKSFADDTENNLNKILLTLGWDKSKLINEASTKLECPYDGSHLINPKKMEAHIAKCRMGPNKYDPSDLLLPENANSDPTTIVKIDAELSAKIISEAGKVDLNFKKGIPNDFPDNRPVSLSYNQMIASFTPDERRVLYDYVVSRAGQKETISDYSFLLKSNSDDKEQPKSALEELAMIRDMKRRRAKYKVSTKSKSYTEVMRGVIENLMASHEEDIKLTTKPHKSKRESPDRSSHCKKNKHDKCDDRHPNHKSKKQKL